MYDLLKLAFNGHEIRTLDIDGNPWFVGADVLSHLYGKASGKGIAYDRLAPDQKRKVNRIDLGEERGGKPMTVISESGLYALVSRSDKAQARPFQDWVNREVLPAIRKDGSYVMGEEKVRTGEMTEDELILAAMEAQKRKIERLAAERDAAVSERDAAKEIIHQELELVTTDEFRALNHQYWEPQVRTRVSQRASKLAKQRGIRLIKQGRFLVNGPGAGRLVFPNVYPRELLAEACAELGVDAR